MADVEFDAQPLQAYAQLEKSGDNRLLDAIDDAVDLIEADPGSAQARRRSYRNGRWGIPVRGHSDDWVIIWEHDHDVIVVRYIGPDPFAWTETSLTTAAINSQHRQPTLSHTLTPPGSARRPAGQAVFPGLGSQLAVLPPAAHDLELVHFAKGQRKDEVTQRMLAGSLPTEGVLYVGRAQEGAAEAGCVVTIILKTAARRTETKLIR